MAIPAPRGTRRCAGALAAAVVVGLACPVTSAQAQRVAFSPRRHHEVDRRLAAYLERDTLDVWTRDTVVERGAELPGDLLILGSVARIAGRVDGDVYVVDGDLFLRPGAWVEGDVVVLGGGYFGSGLATVSGQVEWLPAERYVVLPLAGGLEIHPIESHPPAVDLHGLHGLEAPTYQRVDALTLSWGVTLRAPSWAWRPSLEAVVRFRTGQGEFEGTASQLWHPGPVEFGVEVERATRTTDLWVRGAVSNSLSYFFTGDDFRDYYGSDRVALVVRGDAAGWLIPGFTLEREDATSRNAGGHHTLFGADDVRPNPVVDDGVTFSARIEASVDRTEKRSRLSGRVLLEAADSSIAGDFSFLLAEARVRWRTPGLGAHRLDVFFLGRGDLGGELPRQRWIGFGGRATLPTLRVLSIRGPRMLYGHVGYRIPITAVQAGGFGPPSIFVRISTGAAWAEGQTPDFRTNLAGGLKLSWLEAGLAVDPEAGDGDVTGYAVLRLPGDL